LVRSPNSEEEKLLDRLQESVLQSLDEELSSELIDIASEAVNIPSPTGEEAEMARFLKGRFEEIGLSVSLQEVEEGRNNVVARLKGTGGGQSLLFNGHMDTSTAGEEKHIASGLQPRAKIVDGWMYGLGISNMKSAFAAYYGAIRMIQKTGIELAGDVIVNGVVGEIEKAPVGLYEGRSYRGGGIGTTYAAQHGVLADVAIIGEPTGLRIQAGNTSYMWVRISTAGVAQHTWSKENGVDAIVKSVRIMEALREWEPDLESMYRHPRMGTRIGIGAIEGGYPFEAGVSPAPYCNLYIDVRFPPDRTIMEVRNDIRRFLDRLQASNPELDTELDVYLCRTGYEISHEDQLVRVLEASHRSVLGSEPIFPEPYRYAVSADSSTLHAFGVRALTYGPGGLTRQGTYSMFDADGELCSIRNLLDCTKVYALSLLDLCLRRTTP
jgi:acetylornithine deacetylase